MKGGGVVPEQVTESVDESPHRGSVLCGKVIGPWAWGGGNAQMVGQPHRRVGGRILVPFPIFLDSMVAWLLPSERAAEEVRAHLPLVALFEEVQLPDRCLSWAAGAPW